MTQRRTPEPDRTREREVIVTDRGGPGAGAILGVLLGIVAVVLIGWLLFFRGGGGTTEPEVEVPDEVDVNIDDQQTLGAAGAL